MTAPTSQQHHHHIHKQTCKEGVPCSLHQRFDSHHPDQTPGGVPKSLPLQRLWASCSGNQDGMWHVEHPGLALTPDFIWPGCRGGPHSLAVACDNSEIAREVSDIQWKQAGSGYIIFWYRRGLHVQERSIFLLNCKRTLLYMYKEYTTLWM